MRFLLVIILSLFISLPISASEIDLSKYTTIEKKTEAHPAFIWALGKFRLNGHEVKEAQSIGEKGKLFSVFEPCVEKVWNDGQSCFLARDLR